MELGSIMLRKIGYTQKVKYHMFSVICRILKRDDMKVEGRFKREEFEGRDRRVKESNEVDMIKMYCMCMKMSQ